MGNFTGIGGGQQNQNLESLYNRRDLHSTTLDQPSASAQATDDIETSTSEQPTEAYTSNSNNPQLAKPDVTPGRPTAKASDAFQPAPTLGAQQGTLQQSQPKSTQGQQAFANNFNGTLAQTAADKGLSPQDTALVRYSYYHPEDTNVPPEHQALAANIRSSSQTQVQSDVDPEWQSQPDTEGFDNQTGSLFNESFNGNLQQHAEENNLSPEDTAQLIYASNHPEDESVDPQTKQTLQTLNTQSMGNVSNLYNLPPGILKPPKADPTLFDQKTSADSDMAFEQNLGDLAGTYNLSKGQTARIRYLHYMTPPPTEEETAPQGKTNLQTLRGKAEQRASAHIQRNNGTPPNYAPKPNSANYQATLNGSYADNVRQLIAKFQGPPVISTDEEQQLLMNAIMDPDSPNTPPNLRDASNKLRPQARAAVEKKYKIPPGQFTPNRELIPGGGVMKPQTQNNPAINATRNSISDAEEGTEELSGFVALMPDGEQKTMATNFILLIQEALSAARDMLYEVETTNSTTASMGARLNLQLQQSKIAYQAAQMQKMMDHHAKGGIFSGVEKAFSHLGILGTILNCCLNPLQELDNKIHFSSAFFSMVSAISNAITNTVFRFLPPKARAAMDVAMKVLITAVLASEMMGPMMAVMSLATGGLGPVLMIMYLIQSAPQLLMESGVVQNVVQIYSSSPLAAQIAAMSVAMAVGVAIAVGMMFIPGAQETSALMVARLTEFLAETLGEIATMVMRTVETVGEVISDIGETIADTVSSAGKLGEKFMQAWNKLVETLQAFFKTASSNLVSFQKVNTAVNVGVDLMQGYNNVIQAINSFQKAAVAREQGELNASLDIVNALVQNLQKVINELLNALEGIGQDINNINTQVGTMYQTSSSTVSQMFGGQHATGAAA